jgi:hypothetical protein
MNDKTRLRIAVPAHLYESVKKQLTLKEGKQNFGGDFTVVKEKKASGDSSTKVESSAPASKSPMSKAPSVTKETTEKTLEERVAALEEMLDKAMKNRKKKTTEEGIEDEIGYEAGEQHPDDKPGVSKSLAGGEDKSTKK